MYSVAIDGPAGSGKSTIARILADNLDISYVDTGAMYRAVALKVKEENLDTEDKIKKVVEKINIDFINSKIYMDNIDVSDKIRTEEISKMSSEISKYPFVREKLVEIQQNIAKNKPVVMEGRDIGTVVLPEAEYKFYLTASIESRALRRFKQNEEKGIISNYDEIKEDIILRDENDKKRLISPLMKADDAILIDNSNLTLEENVEEMLRIIRG